MEYNEFLKGKRAVPECSGFDISKSDINPQLFDFQRDIVRWAVKKGKAAVFAGTGLGCELKQSYFDQAIKNLMVADRKASAPKQVGFDYFSDGRD